MSFYWSVAWRNLWRQKRRSLITAVAMAIGVAMTMAMVCWSAGMYSDMFGLMVEQQLGHVQVHHPDYPAKGQIYDTLSGRDALVESIDAHGGTVAASPRLQGYGLIGGDVKSTGGLIAGIDPARDRGVTPLVRRIVAGAYLSEEAGHEIVLGHELADEVDAEVGGTVVVLTQAADGSTGNDLYTVVGLYRTGDVMLDRGAYLHIADAEVLLALEDQAHGITVLTDHADHVEAFGASLSAALEGDGVEVQTWWEADPLTAEMMGMQDATTWIMLIIVFAIAIFGVVNTMLMSVFERTRELGVLRALGLRPLKLVWLVVWESVFLAAVSAGIGLVLGLAADWYLIVYGMDLSASMPNGMSYMGVVLDPVFKGEFALGPVIVTVVCVFVVSVLASLWPAWRAARLQPVTAIRAE